MLNFDQADWKCQSNQKAPSPALNKTNSEKACPRNKTHVLHYIDNNEKNKNFYATLNTIIDETKRMQRLSSQSIQPVPAKCSCLFPLPCDNIRAADFLCMIQRDWRTFCTHHKPGSCVIEN